MIFNGKLPILLILFSIFLIYLFPLNVPLLDDRTYACAEEGGINSITHKLPATDFGGSHIIFGDGERGRIPSENSKHHEAEGHIIFGDGIHGLINELCGSSDIRNL